MFDRPSWKKQTKKIKIKIIFSQNKWENDFTILKAKKRTAKQTAEILSSNINHRLETELR